MKRQGFGESSPERVESGPVYVDRRKRRKDRPAIGGEAMFYESLSEERVPCNLCNHRCTISEG